MYVNKKCYFGVTTYLFAGDKIFWCTGVNSFDRSIFKSLEPVTLCALEPVALCALEPAALCASPKPVSADNTFMSVNLDDGVCAGLEL